MKTIVTGASGFLGKWLVNQLLKQEHQVFAFVRDVSLCPAEWAADHNLTPIFCPLNKLKAMPGQFEKHKPFDYFFHLAWEGTWGSLRADPATQIRNIEYACDALKLAESMGCDKYINTGSIMEYDVVKMLTQDTVVPETKSIYSAAKLSANMMCRMLASNMKLSYINVIISNTYGPGEKSDRFINTIIHKMLANESIPLTLCSQTYDFIYVQDAVDAILTVAERGSSNQSYYIGNTVQKPLREYVLQMRDVLSSQSELEFGSIPLNGETLTYQEFDTGKMEKDLGFKPIVGFKEGIAKTRDWIIANEY